VVEGELDSVWPIENANLALCMLDPTQEVLVAASQTVKLSYRLVGLFILNRNQSYSGTS
jgi:hypothetical protein